MSDARYKRIEFEKAAGLWEQKLLLRKEALEDSKKQQEDSKKQQETET